MARNLKRDTARCNKVRAVRAKGDTPQHVRVRLAPDAAGMFTDTITQLVRQLPPIPG